MDDSFGPPVTMSPMKTEDERKREKVIFRRKACAALVVLAALVGGIVALLLNTTSRFSSSTSTSSSWVHHSSYQHVSNTKVREIQADLVVYRHKKTQTQVITVVPLDGTQDATFGVSFRTLPDSSNGAPHVLEHAVLNGSEKYPSKDPFNALLRGSLHTFLNAMTYPDRTVYAVASRNFADFQNLMSVYLDAVFKPRAITQEGSWILRQEGWRVDEKSDDELEFNGVVLNEMKGVYSDPDELLNTYTQTALFPDSPYRHDSGGEPSTIPTLTRQDFEKFYRKFYHPSNAQIYVYGSPQHVEACLNQADEYLQQHEVRLDIRQDSIVPWQPKSFLQPKTVQKPYPSSKGDASDYKVQITWLINDEELHPMMEVAWYVLDYLLLGTTTSVLQDALLKSNLGDYVIDDGFDATLQQATFSVGLEGLENEGDMKTVETLIMDTLQGVVDNGFKEPDIKSAMNSVAFEILEPGGEDNPRGIELLLGGLSKWNYDFDPKTAVQSDKAFQELKDIVSGSGSKFFVRMVKDLLRNTHRVNMELLPDPNLAQKQEQEEEERLDEISRSEDFELLILEYNNMKAVQAIDDPPSVLAKIPSLSVEELDKTGNVFPIQVAKDFRGSGVTVLKHEVATSFGIAYVNFGLDISAIDFDDIHLLPLLTRLMIEAGKDIPNGDLHLARQIGMYTGGVDTDTLILPVRPASVTDDNFQALDGNHLSTKLFLSGKCTTENAPKLFAIFKEILLEGTLDVKSKAISFLKEMLSDMEYSVSSDGDSVAYQRLKARYNVVNLIAEKLGGITTLRTLAAELHTAKSDWSSLLARLERMKATILSGHRNGAVLNLTGDKNVLKSIQAAVDKFVDKHLPPVSDAAPFIDFAEEEHPWVSKATQKILPAVNEAFVIPTQVSYVGEGGFLFQPGEVIDGSALVVARYLSRGYLYEQLRLQRGAYGASAHLDIRGGTFAMTSYRDPNLVSTLEVYDGAAVALTTAAVSQRSGDNSTSLPPQASKAIIGTIGSLDGSAPQNSEVGVVSLRQWLRGESNEMRQNWRNQILDTQWSDFRAFADRLAVWEEPTISVVTSATEYQDAVSNGINLERHNPLSDSSTLRRKQKRRLKSTTTMHM